MGSPGACVLVTVLPVTFNRSLASLASCRAKNKARFGVTSSLNPGSAACLRQVTSSLWSQVPALKTGVTMSILRAVVRTKHGDMHTVLVPNRHPCVFRLSKWSEPWKPKPPAQAESLSSVSSTGPDT